MTDWIPVSERLPTEPNYYLVTRYSDIEHDAAYAWIVWYNGERFSYDNREVTVLAWMPLPEPYQPPS